MSYISSSYKRKESGSRNRLNSSASSNAVCDVCGVPSLFTRLRTTHITQQKKSANRNDKPLRPKLWGTTGSQCMR